MDDIAVEDLCDRVDRIDVRGEKNRRLRIADRKQTLDLQIAHDLRFSGASRGNSGQREHVVCECIAGMSQRAIARGIGFLERNAVGIEAEAAIDSDFLGADSHKGEAAAAYSAMQ